MEMPIFKTNYEKQEFENAASQQFFCHTISDWSA